jgi:hypothetical protein
MREVVPYPGQPLFILNKKASAKEINIAFIILSIKESGSELSLIRPVRTLKNV